MKLILASFLLVLMVSFSGCNSQQETDFVAQWDTIRVLKNPHKGWYHHLLDNGIDKYPIRNDSVFATFPGMDHLYLRLAWSYLEPEEGKYNWHYIDDIVSKYAPEGYHFSFRISSKETGTFPGSVGQQLNGVQYATPYWVMKAGAKGVIAENDKTKSWTPDWDDSIYLEKLNNFHKAFANRYDGKAWVSYIDIGSIGEWGEGHTHFSTRIPPTMDEVKANIGVFLNNYKKSQLVVTDDLLYYGKPDNEVKELYDFAVSKGITLRDDSPMVDWYIAHNLKTWSVSHPQFYDSLYLNKPIVFELQHYPMVKKDGNWLGKNGSDTIPALHLTGADILRKAIETMHATYIGYHGFAEEWLADNPDLTNELANRCGYWLFPVKANFPSKLEVKGNSVGIEWLNKGIAPPYFPFQLVLRLKAKTGSEKFDITLSDLNNAKWYPDKKVSGVYQFDIPQGMDKGDYLLAFKLIDNSSGVPVDIALGLKSDFVDSEGFQLLGTVLY